MSLYIGIDLGTSSVKLMLVDGERQIKNTVTREREIARVIPVCALSGEAAGVAAAIASREKCAIGYFRN